MLNLKDPSLLRQQCFINGEWCDANDAQHHHGHQSGHRREPSARVPHMGAAETKRAIDAANAAWPAWRKTSAKERSRDPAQVERPDAGKRRRPGADHDRRTGQAAAGSEGRSGVRRLVLRVVRRRSQAHRRRHLAVAVGRPPAGGHARADRRVRGDHAVELPGRDDHPQGRPGAGRRLPDRRQAGRADAVLGAGAGGAGRARRRAEGRVFGDHRRLESRSGWR